MFVDAASILFSDEQNVFEETAAYPLPVGSTTLLDRTPDPTPNRADPYDRLHVHLSTRPGARDAVVDALSAGLRTLAGRRRTSSSPGSTRSSRTTTARPTRLRRTWPTVVDERVGLVVLEIVFTDFLARRRALEEGPFREVNAALAGLVSHITAFAVSGVFTFVRDGRSPTRACAAAGWRS